MTDKQIIENKNGFYCIEPCSEIKQLKEQLKAKEQECENNKTAHQMELAIYNQECLNLQEELKEALEQLEAYKMEVEEGKEINAELKAEYEKLKKEINDLEDLAIFKTNTIRELREEIEIAKQNYSYEAEKLEIYIQTLAEIKEIAKECFGKDFCTDCKYCEQCYIEDEKIPTYDVCKLILQKINECEIINE